MYCANTEIIFSKSRKSTARFDPAREESIIIQYICDCICAPTLFDENSDYVGIQPDNVNLFPSKNQ